MHPYRGMAPSTAHPVSRQAGHSTSTTEAAPDTEGARDHDEGVMGGAFNRIAH